MNKIVTFNELRKLKDSLPDGSMNKIAEQLGIEAETVRNYFGGQNYSEGSVVGVHIESGPCGGLVTLDDTTIYDLAVEMAKKS